MDITACIAAYHAGTATAEQIDAILDAYQPLIRKYVGILLGRIASLQGRPLMSDFNVRALAHAVTRTGNPDATMAWLVKECRAFSSTEIVSEVTGAVLQCAQSRGTMKAFPYVLAKSLAQLIGNPVDRAFVALTDDLPAPEPNWLPRLTKVEQMCWERGIALTPRERQLVKLLSIDYNITGAATTMAISRQRASRMLQNIRRKAALA